MENFEKRFRWRLGFSVLFAALMTGILAWLWGVLPVGASGQAADSAGLELSIADAGTRQRVAARVRVRDQAGHDYAPHDAVEVPIGKDRWFVAPGTVRLTIPLGNYSIRVERGTEYRPVMQSVVISASGLARQIELQRWVNMRDRGYESGEDHLHVPLGKLGPMLAAEDLEFGAMLSWWNGPKLELPPGLEMIRTLSFAGQTMEASVFDAEVENAWGAVYLIGLPKPISLSWDPGRSNLPFVKLARQQRGLICYEDGGEPEVLIDALLGYVDVVNICDTKFQRHKFSPRTQYSNLLGVEGFPIYRNTADEMLRMNTETYYRLLNCGLRLAAGAGSAGGGKTTPAGYNRAYVRTMGKSTLPEFLEAWRHGTNFVTNGPMVFLSADDDRGPGETIALPIAGGIVNLKAVATYDQPLTSLEIVANGEVVGHSDVPPSAVSAELTLHLEVKQGTWIAARAKAEDRLLSDQELSRYRRESAEHRGEEPTRLRFGHTSPIYVTVAGKGARVAQAIREAREMIEAFRRFSNANGSERWKSEITDALPAALEKLDHL